MIGGGRVNPVCLRLALSVSCLLPPALAAGTTHFFDPSQVATPVSSGVTSETFSSNGFVFTCTRDKLFTGGTGQIIGRSVRVPWPQGVEAQAVTTPPLPYPPGGPDYKARLTIRREDGAVFDLTAFSVKLLASTAGAGGAVEIMPLLNGEDGLSDAVQFNTTGFYGQVFSFDGSPNVWGSTALLRGFDTYKVSLYVDFAFTAITLDCDACVDPVPPCPGDFNNDAVVDLADLLDFLADWNPNLGQSVPPGSIGDLNSDGIVDLADLLDFLADWNPNLGQNCP
ncbi:MAG: hypothetical protein KF768_13105 [Phycisphaeraceae bacterium]|nr:hypothetical protein [Phycisphaeraceae bacterium]